MAVPPLIKGILKIGKILDQIVGFSGKIFQGEGGRVYIGQILFQGSGNIGGIHEIERRWLGVRV